MASWPVCTTVEGLSLTSSETEVSGSPGITDLARSATVCSRLSIESFRRESRPRRSSASAALAGCWLCSVVTAQASGLVEPEGSLGGGPVRSVLAGAPLHDARSTSGPTGRLVERYPRCWAVAPSAHVGRGSNRAARRHAVPPGCRSDRAYVLRLRALLALRDVELDALRLVQRPVAATADRREVAEDVGAATVLLD